jgi:hypothetical protein
MIANSAFLAALILLVVMLELMSQLTFLARYKHLIFGRYLWFVVGALLVLFFNLFASIYWVGRRIWLKDTGRKLAHLERQLDTRDTVARELSDRLSHQD